MRKALIVGGSNGIGLSLVKNMDMYDRIYIIDKVAPEIDLGDKVSYEYFDLRNQDFTIFKNYEDINCLVITSGFGSLGLFEELDDTMINDLFSVNTVAVIRLIKQFYTKINSKEDFYCAVMGSISGFLSSPFFSVYGASKAAICKFIESVNVELEKGGSVNRILNVSPGSIKGTQFYNEKNNIELTTPLARAIIKKLHNKDDLFIPQYEEIFKSVLDRYHTDFREFGLASYEYKQERRKLK